MHGAGLTEGSRRWPMKVLSRRALWLSIACVVCSAGIALAQEAGADPAPASARAVGLGFAAALAITGSVVGAGYAVARIGSAALGAAAEKPDLLAKSLLFVALAEGMAVLGFAIAMLLIQKI